MIAILSALGATPSDKSGSVGKKVKSRMQKEGRYDPKTESVLEGGKWIPTSACDMSHVVDAVLWWNTNGRFTGAQSGAVKAFMNDPNNYILESSGAKLPHCGGVSIDREPDEGLESHVCPLLPCGPSNRCAASAPGGIDRQGAREPAGLSGACADRATLCPGDTR